MAQEVSGRALREPALVANATGAASVSAHAGDGQARVQREIEAFRASGPDSWRPEFTSYES